MSEDKGEAEVTTKSAIVPLSAAKLKPAMTAYLNAQSNMKEHQGALGDVIKNRVAPTGCSPKAFKLIAQMKRMSPEKCADFLRSFDQLVDMFDLRAEPDMVDLAEEGSEKKKAAPKKAAAKKAPAKKANGNGGTKPVDVKSPANLPEKSGVPSGVKPAAAADAAPPVH